MIKQRKLLTIQCHDQPISEWQRDRCVFKSVPAKNANDIAHIERSLSKNQISFLLKKYAASLSSQAYQAFRPTQLRNKPHSSL
jgi:hypothetical protein